MPACAYTKHKTGTLSSELNEWRSDKCEWLLISAKRHGVEETRCLNIKYEWQFPVIYFLGDEWYSWALRNLMLTRGTTRRTKATTTKTLMMMTVTRTMTMRPRAALMIYGWLFKWLMPINRIIDEQTESIHMAMALWKSFNGFGDATRCWRVSCDGNEDAPIKTRNTKTMSKVNQSAKPSEVIHSHRNAFHWQANE